MEIFSTNTNLGLAGRIVGLLCCLVFTSHTIANTPILEDSWFVLPTDEIRQINNLTENSQVIEPWLIAQLLHVSADLDKALSVADKEISLIALNELLAQPDQYQGKVVTLKTLFVNSQNVKEQLELAPDEKCWSVLLLDTKYHQVLQLFTSQNPEKFQKNQILYAVGVFLTTRRDEAIVGEGVQPLTVPVFIGTLLPLESSAAPARESARFVSFLIVIICLTVVYIFVRIYVGRSLNRR